MQYEYVTTKKRAGEILARLVDSGRLHALDFETTGLVPGIAKIRLTSICGPVGNFVFDHFKCGSFEDYATDLATISWAVFNSMFEGRWFDHATDGPDVVLYDVGHMSKAKLGGRPLSFKQQVQRDLGIALDKEEQRSDWSVPELRQEQLDYAFDDAYYTYELYKYWDAELTDAQWNGFIIINDAWRATAEMEDTGFDLDPVHHQKLINMWTLRRDAAEKALRRWTDEKTLPNLRSKKQLSDFVAGVLGPEQADAVLEATPGGRQYRLDKNTLRQLSFRTTYPFSRWIAALMVFNRADKYLGTYGQKLLNIHGARGGKIYCRFNIAQAITGRYSSSEPNLQNIPRNPLCRQSFIALAGEVLCIADYSGIELRVLAEMADDDGLRQDVIFGNVHAESAIHLFKIDRDEFYERLAAKDPYIKELRARAKAFSFQLTYGAGPGALAVVMRCSDDEAALFIRAWADKYPKAYHFRQHHFELMTASGFLECASGRTIYVAKQDRSIPVASNYPIQGSAADVMYCALKRINDDAYLRPEPMRMVASVHDEIILKTKAEFGEIWEKRQVKHMKLGWLDVFPGTATDNLVESGTGMTWAAKH